MTPCEILDRDVNGELQILHQFEWKPYLHDVLYRKCNCGMAVTCCVCDLVFTTDRKFGVALPMHVCIDPMTDETVYRKEILEH